MGLSFGGLAEDVLVAVELSAEGVWEGAQKDGSDVLDDLWDRKS